MTTDVVRRATAGFIVSLIAGVLILINAVAFFSLADFVASFGSMVPIIPFFVEGVLEILAAIGVILAIIILIGAILIFAQTILVLAIIAVFEATTKNDKTAN